ncbi:MAG: mechanosensitive ion channel [Dysgonamonadaceae bacterium]|jgi:small-conductance mechanosensitive channel|nr:mechanosensitive ion channel [Dysgonamonadaceae bacterium]
MNNKKLDFSVASFFRSLISIILTAALIIGIINILNFQSSSFVALPASIGVALGMAMSGALQNFAGGVMILLFRPYRVGDYNRAQAILAGITTNEKRILSNPAPEIVIKTMNESSIDIPFPQLTVYLAKK